MSRGNKPRKRRLKTSDRVTLKKPQNSVTTPRGIVDTHAASLESFVSSTKKHGAFLAQFDASQRVGAWSTFEIDLTHTAMLPKTLALVDDDKEYTEFLSQFLRELGVTVDVFLDSNILLAHADAYRYDFYVVDLMFPGVDGANLIKVLRLRSTAGILVVSGQLAPDVFAQVISAGADMYLAKPVQFEQVAIAIKAVQRRAVAAGTTSPAWRLDRRAQQLLAPDGARVDLSETDLAVVECFVLAGGEPVTRDALRLQLGQDTEPDALDSLNSTIYRLRRRIERATPTAVPLQAKSRVGYVFRAPLQAV